MSSLDFFCHDSIYFPMDCNPTAAKKSYLYLGQDHGHDYAVYLSFQLPSLAYLCSLKKASLLLFKLNATNPEDYKSAYFAAPLLHPFNYYHCTFSPPVTSDAYQTEFSISDCNGYTEIDITSTIQAWNEGKIENNGLLLFSERNARLIRYASLYHEVTCMHPVLRLSYLENCFCPNLTSTPCDIMIQ